MTETQQKHVEKAAVTGTTPTQPCRIHFIDEEARVAYENTVVFTPKYVRFILV